MSFLGIEIARRSLQAHQRALTVTAHNIANINTPGYSRQAAVFQTTSPISYPSVGTPKPGQIGTGMMNTEIIRYRDVYLDRQVREAKSAIGYADGMETALQRVEAVIPEPSEFGIQAMLGSFFSAWHYLAQDPENPGSRAAVKGAAEMLANSFSMVHDSLTSVKVDLVGVEMDDPSEVDPQSLFAQQLRDINAIGKQISELNWESAYQRTAGTNPNDLMDRRDRLLEQLATLADVTVTVSSIDLNLVSVDVYGVQLVDGTQYREIGNGFVELEAEDARESLIGNTRGSLAATVAAAENIDGYLEMLETLMGSLADVVNDRLNAEFFVYGEGRLALNEEAMDALKQVTATQAWSVAQVREQRVVGDVHGDGQSTLDGYYRELVTGIGADLATTMRGRDNVQAILGQIELLRESVSGVNLDEELTRMMQYQYGYQAAARVVTMMDELLDTLINRMM
ncbi:MAG: flagellar hook-associated protein FlgK [Eubacteriales bacterium]|nr:flagellar hook-associated protein FlgK [Bacillota bacterium]MBV1727712.1 flagellar hook-associated protein FlgK [Desulforudis sp.]MDP3051426.1 flagellar hook-associated protein FlgK [Eubacteriales bacterium]MDQ7789259.1 flagellar hook-associated protein FlgK [Clostridia bacterium]MBU4532774.1 flagellar hook-associated protein FlgK [Bacillota bacterium]